MEACVPVMLNVILNVSLVVYINVNVSIPEKQMVTEMYSDFETRQVRELKKK